MPINYDNFIHIPEFSLAANRFMRRLIHNEYQPWIEENNLNEPFSDIKNLPRELSTFSDDIENDAKSAHNYLLVTTQLDGNEQINSLKKEYLSAISAYTINSQPFHAVTRNLTLLSEYEDFDAALLSELFGDPDKAARTVDNLQNALLLLDAGVNAENKKFTPKPDFYDVAYWTPGSILKPAYSGLMVFRGALTLQTTLHAVNNPFGAIYNYGNISGEHVINEGDIVTNSDFMSTSAHPSVAAEFVVRQASWVPGANGIEIPRIVVDAMPRRVFFRIDMFFSSDNGVDTFTKGRIVVPWTRLSQAEILFPLFTYFKVISIKIDNSYGLLVHLEELNQGLNPLPSIPKNMFTGHPERLPGPSVNLDVIPIRGGLQPISSSDPTISALKNAISILGLPIGALINEEFGVGNISTTDFYFNVNKIANPSGDRVEIIFNGLFMPMKIK